MSQHMREQFRVQRDRVRMGSEFQSAPLYVVIGKGGVSESGERYPTAAHIMGGSVTPYVWWRYAQQGRRFRVLRCYHHGKRVALAHSANLLGTLVY
jgi:hypothetical protein